MKRLRMGRIAAIILALATGERGRGEPPTTADDFNDGLTARWRVADGEWAARRGRIEAGPGPARLVWSPSRFRDFEATVDVGYQSEETHAASGIAFRLDDDGTGYVACLREVERGIDDRFGPWERPLLQLWRIDPEGWSLLQESKAADCRSGVLRRLRVVCRGPNIAIFYRDMDRPVLSEFDDRHDREGEIALWKDSRGEGLFDDFAVGPPTAVPAAPSQTDWSWVRGAVYVRSDAVNAVQMWLDYDDHVDVLDRELSYAADYGFNMVQVYLHWIVWQHLGGPEYLRRIDDILSRADRHGLKANLIFWDDCGHVEPATDFDAPIPGRHNSQMMPNPSHRIRGDEVELQRCKNDFRLYVEGIAGRFKDDPRIAFWQLYNEAMGPREQYRRREPDANIERLLDWTRGWVKGTGTSTPVTATGGGFYGASASDFPSFHSYGAPDGSPLPNTGGGPEHLCTETLNRPAKGIEACLRELADRGHGFVVWELMIGRDNCRFPWDHDDGPDEPEQPFHGFVYPDGHPWSLDEARALLGESRFQALAERSFRVDYHRGRFAELRKTSIAPRIDFNLGDEPGTGSPDASAGIGKDDFSIRWTGTLLPPASGLYRFEVESDGEATIRIEGAAADSISLEAGRPVKVVVEYVHHEGEARCRVLWSGPGFGRRIFRLRGS